MAWKNRGSDEPTFAAVPVYVRVSLLVPNCRNGNNGADTTTVGDKGADLYADSSATMLTSVLFAS